MKGNMEAEKLATDALKDSKGDVRAAAANALGTMQARRAKPALEAALGKHPPDVCDYCGERGMRKTRTYSAKGVTPFRSDDWTCRKVRKDRTSDHQILEL